MLRNKMNFTEFLKKEKTTTNKALAEFLAEQRKEFGQFDGDFDRLLKHIATLVLRGGKRARSMLVRLAYELACGKKASEEIVKASLFVELIHLNLLVHDDIADRDLKRYGGPSLEMVFGDWFKKRFGEENEHFGVTMAMIGGDYLLNLAHLALNESGVEAAKKVECERIMASVLTQTYAGWQIQYWQNFEAIGEARKRKFLKAMELVSAKYSFKAPLMIGLVLGGGVKKYGAILGSYAYHVGMAFQLQDDILGVFGETNETGKPSGNDVREGKKTLLVLEAYKRGDSKERELLDRVVGSSLNESELKKVREIIVRTGALEYSKKLAASHVLKAKKSLDRLKPRGKEVAAILEHLAEFVVKRNY